MVKMFGDMFSSFDTIQQHDTQTPHDSICIVSCGKNEKKQKSEKTCNSASVLLQLSQSQAWIKEEEGKCFLEIVLFKLNAFVFTAACGSPKTESHILLCTVFILPIFPQ